jgi:transcriptional regulator with XRE-family HTH domain
MKTKKGRAIRELRDIINLTQGEFAAIIGASKDTVASWEVGRNKLSRQFARRIALATGVEAEDLMRGRSRLMTYVPMAGRLPLTKETFQQHRQSYWGATDEAAARRHLKNGADALGLILLAAAGGPDGKGAKCLPAVLESFIEWCEQTREDFQLEAAIDQLLAERKGEVSVSQS